MVMKDESEMFWKRHCSLCLDICQTELEGFERWVLLFLVPHDPSGTWQVILFIPLFLSFWKPFWRKRKTTGPPKTAPPSFVPLARDVTLKYLKLFYCLTVPKNSRHSLTRQASLLSLLILVVRDLLVLAGLVGLPAWPSWCYLVFIWLASWSPNLTNTQHPSKTSKQTSLAHAWTPANYLLLVFLWKPRSIVIFSILSWVEC